MGKSYVTRHTISGAIDKNTPEHILNHPTLGRFLEVVDETAKPFAASIHKPREAKPVPVKPTPEQPATNKNGKD